MNATYIDIFYVRLMLKQPRLIAVTSSPSSVVGGWLVVKPKLKTGR